jgi:hypothetical protein
VRSSSGSRMPRCASSMTLLCDKSCRWIVTSFQMQSLTRCYEGSGHSLNDLRLKGLMGKIGSDRHETRSLPYRRERTCLSATDACGQSRGR